MRLLVLAAPNELAKPFVPRRCCASAKIEPALERLPTMKSTKEQQRPSAAKPPWSPQDLWTLRDGFRTGTSIPQLAQKLRRDIADVRAKVAEITMQHLADRAGAGKR
jgi:hypothetical protein